MIILFTTLHIQTTFLTPYESLKVEQINPIKINFKPIQISAGNDSNILIKSDKNKFNKTCYDVMRAKNFPYTGSTLHVFASLH